MSLGVELLSNPSFLLVDECTSGLDATSAIELIQLLRNITIKYNRTVIATVHQPSVQMFNMFTHTMLLSQGQCCYFGATSDVKEFMETTLNKQLPIYMSFPEWVLEQLNVDFTPENLQQVDKLASAYNTNYQKQHQKTIQGNATTTQSAQSQSQPYLSNNNNHASFLHTIWILIRRTTWNNLINPSVFQARLIMYCMLSLMLSKSDIKQK